MDRIFRIRRKSDGKFVVPGEYTKFSKNGKIFIGEKAVLKAINDYYGDFTEIVRGKSVFCEYRKEELEVVEYAVAESATTPFETWRKRANDYDKQQFKKQREKVKQEQLRTFGETF